MNNVVGVSHNHQTEKAHKDVQALKFYNQAIDSVPKDINLHFANLEVLVFGSCPIQALTKDDLAPFPKLKQFQIYSGNLTTINGDVFKHSPKLHYLSFSYNQITNVGPGIFQHTPQLTYAYFQNNLCIDIYAKNNATAVAMIANQLAVKCPPTVKMTEEIILGGEKFKTAVRIQTTELERKVEKLENFLGSLCRRYQICN